MSNSANESGYLPLSFSENKFFRRFKNLPASNKNAAIFAAANIAMPAQQKIAPAIFLRIAESKQAEEIAFSAKFLKG